MKLLNYSAQRKRGIVFTFLLLITTVSCKTRQEHVTKERLKENPLLTSVPKYEYPDEFFNYNF